MQLYVQRDQPPGVPPLSLTGERTLPDVPEENYWFRRHLVVYEWIAARAHGRHIVDLACGEGADVIWLAENGWTATGVDISPTAIERGREAAGAAGLTGASFVAADLSAWSPSEPVDLVCSSFLHSEVEFPRMEILRTPESVFDFRYDDFRLVGYDPHPAIPAPVAV